MDFFELIVQFLNSGVLAHGDILILDNAKIHKAEEIMGMLRILLDTAGVRMFFLPTYSPEVLILPPSDWLTHFLFVRHADALQYNPCELIFARAKRYLRDERGRASFLSEVLEGFGCVTWDSVAGYYHECILKPFS